MKQLPYHKWFLNAVVGLATMVRPPSIMAQVPPANEWQRSMGGTDLDYANSIQPTNDGGYILAGVTQSNNGDVMGNHGNADAWIVKLDPAGLIEWQHAYGGSSFDAASSVLQTIDGGYVFAGYTASNDGDVTGNHGQMDVWIVKIDSTGGMEWTNCYGGANPDYGNAITQTMDGGYIVGGGSRSTSDGVTNNHGGSDCWILRLDDAGSVLWEQAYGGSFYDTATALELTSDGGVLFVGESMSNDGDLVANHGGSDFWVVKINSSGEIQWQHSFGGSNEDQARGCLPTMDGGFLVVGETSSQDGDVTGNHGGSDAWVLKLDSIGNLQWKECYGGTSNDGAEGVIQIEGGGYVIAGATASNDGDVSGNHGGLDAWLVRLDSAGSIVWQKPMGGPSGDTGSSIVQNNQGKYILAGTAQTNGGDVSGNHGGQDAWVVKLGVDDVGIDDLDGSSIISLYPNPVRDMLNIHWTPGTPVPETIKLLTADGRCLATLPTLQAPLVSTDFQISVGHLAAGTYFVQVSDAVQSWMKRFVKL